MDVTGVELEYPASKSPAVRLDWASERLWDFAEGKLSREQLGLVIAVLTGWSDLASDDERRGYKAMARQAQDLLDNT